MSGFVWGIVFFSACSAIGIGFGNKYRRTYVFWRDFTLFNRIAKVQIKSFSTSPENIINVFTEGDFKTFAESYIKNRDECQAPEYLSMEEKEYLISYFRRFQRVDFSAIEEYLDGTAPYLKEREDQAKAYFEQNAKLSRKLGFLGGLAAFILVI